jgi:hypothetical protein
MGYGSWCGASIPSPWQRDLGYSDGTPANVVTGEISESSGIFLGPTDQYRALSRFAARKQFDGQRHLA